VAAELKHRPIARRNMPHVEPRVGSESVRTLASRLDRLEERFTSFSDEVVERLDSALGALEFIVDDDPRARRALRQLRGDPEYERAYTEVEPLVSVIIPTWNRTQSLIRRSIPSVLAQTHANVEVVVIGDASPPELVAAVSAISDPRVRFFNRSIRGPYPDDPLRAWSASGTPSMTEGLQRARGRWLTIIGDDDALPPNHIAALLEFVRERRLEFACGRFRVVNDGDATQMLGSFPPELGSSGFQISLWHAGLRFLEVELAHAQFTTPNDWGLIRRMMRIGVVMGQKEDAIVDYKPSGRGLAFGEARVDERVTLRRQLTELREQNEALCAARRIAEARLSDRVAEGDRATAELQRRLVQVTASKSWRLTAPLRQLVRIARDQRRRGQR
jgi:hypothetical protein